MSIQGYRLGMPFWGFKDWTGLLYRPGSAVADFLPQYAEVFNAVEGNTTFYSLPAPETVCRWRDQTPPDFRFCFKFPQLISHKRQLRGAAEDTRAFLRLLEPLGPRVGPLMLQLPATFGPSRLPVLASFLQELPEHPAVAVELRHPALCSGEGERRANELLGEHDCDRVIMDTRAMRSGDPTHPDVIAAAHEKPNLPVRPVVTATTPLVRFVGHPDAAANTPWIQAWAERLAAWMAQGREPFFFVHVPNNAHAPGLARRLHERLARQRDVGTLPPFPGTVEDAAGQLKLL